MLLLISIFQIYLKPTCIELVEQVEQEKSGIALSFCSPDENSYIKLIESLIEKSIKIITDHPYVINPPKHRKKQPNTISKNKKGRKSEASKKKKKRWY